MGNNKPSQNDAGEGFSLAISLGKVSNEKLFVPLIGKMITAVLDDITISGEFVNFSSNFLKINNPQFIKSNDWLVYSENSQNYWDELPGISGDFILLKINDIKEMYQNNKLTATEKSIKDIIE